MKAPNHLAGGTVLTGFLCSLCGVNIFDSAAGLSTLLVGCLLPDIDSPRSLMGRLCPPVAHALQRRYGRRTITHSGVLLLALTLALGTLECATSGGNKLTLIFFFAYFSHLLLDMLTQPGVPLLYPWFRGPFVMPASPKWRLRGDDLRGEAIIFGAFLVLGLFMQPLFANGFWTSYNRLFGSLRHLAIEYRRSEDLLLVDYAARRGSERLTGRGYCLNADHNEVTLLTEAGQLIHLRQGEVQVDRVVPTHTGRRLYYDRHAITAWPLDSVNRTFGTKLLHELQLSSEQDFRTVLPDGSTQEGKTFSGQMLRGVQFVPVPQPIVLDTFLYEPNPRIALLEAELRELRRRHAREGYDWQQHQLRLATLGHRLRHATGPVEADAIYTQYQQALKEAPPNLDAGRLRLLATEIALLRRQEYRANEARALAVRQRNAERWREPPRLSGYVTVIRME